MDEWCATRVSPSASTRAPRPNEIAAFPKVVRFTARARREARVLFLTADDAAAAAPLPRDARRHPLSARCLAGRSPAAGAPPARAHRHLALEPLVTTRMTCTSCARRCRHRSPMSAPAASRAAAELRLQNGTPASVDFMFDARCLPNPHWVPSCAPHGPRCGPSAFLEGTPETQEWFAMCATTCAAATPLPPARSRLSHRCHRLHRRPAPLVYLVERLGRELRGEFEPLSVKHRDLGI